MMPPKSRDKGKALHQKLESPKPLNPLKLLSSAKPIKSWIDIVIEKENVNHSSQVKK